MARSAVIGMSLPQFDTCNLPCVYALFRLHSITRYVFKTLQAFAFEGQNMTFNVNTLLTCIPYCDLGPDWVIRTVCNIVITDIIFVLHRHLGFTLRKLYVCFICRRSYIFLAYIWASLCLLSSMYKFIPPFVTFVCSGTTWFNLRHVCCVLYMPVVSLVQARLCFRSSIWISSVSSISKILGMNYRSARNCQFLLVGTLPAGITSISYNYRVCRLDCSISSSSKEST